MIPPVQYRRLSGHRLLLAVSLASVTWMTAPALAVIQDKAAAPTIRISGRVVDEATGNGIAEVSVRAYSVEGQLLKPFLDGRTDAEGKYEIPAEPGTLLVHPNSVPTSHIGLGFADCPKIEAKQSRAWPDIKLKRAATLHGVVLDQDGRPVAGAEIRVTRPDLSTGFGDIGLPVRSGGDGSFVIESLDPDDTIPVRARAGAAATDGALLVETKEQVQAGKITVRVDPRFTSRVQGRVVDGNGRPIAGAPVSVWWSRMYTSRKLKGKMGLMSVLEEQKTAPDGRFESGPLWAGDHYKVSVGARGSAQADTTYVVAQAGKVHDFGTISLGSASAHVNGRVVDSSGRPIANATVFNRGDAPRTISTRTDAEGRFRLEGFYSASKFAFARRDGVHPERLADALRIAGRKYLFVRKEGYRFGGLAVDGDGQDVELKLLRQDERPADWKPGATFPEAEAKAFARETIERLRGRARGNGANRSARLISLMASVDPDRAEAWLAEDGLGPDSRNFIATMMQERDPAAALEMLRRGGSPHPSVLVSLAVELADDDPTVAAQLIAESVPRLRAEEGRGRRVRALAEAVGVLTRQGRLDEARPIREQLALDAEKLGLEGMDAYARGAVARAIAPIDRKRAAALLAPIPSEPDRTRYTGWLIEGIAQDAARDALPMIDGLKTNSDLPQTLRTNVAYHLAPADPDGAERLIESEITGRAATKQRADAYSWLAVAVAHRDKSRAFRLIDRAMDLPVDNPGPFNSYTYFGAGLSSSAAIALNARRVGYPDMGSVALRVMAARLDESSDPATQAQSATKATPLVALLDPSLAATILGQIEARGGLAAAEVARNAGEPWLAAWALADLGHAKALTHMVLSQEKPPERGGFSEAAVFEMLEVLVTPPQRRERVLRRMTGAIWSPTMEY